MGGFLVLKGGVSALKKFLEKFLWKGGVLIFITMNLRETIKRILNEELDTTKSNYEKQKRILEKLFKSKSYEGVCRYDFRHDEDNDRVGGVYVVFSSDWYRLSDEQKYLNLQLMKIQTTKRDIRQIAKRFLGIENLYVVAYLENCNLSLNEETTPKDVSFQKVLKRVIPDGSTYEMSYDLPYADEGKVHVFMKYGTLPTSKLMRMDKQEGGFFYGIQLNIQIDELLWKSDFDPEWENVRRPMDLPSNFWSYFEDDMSDEFRKSLGIEYVEVYFRNPD